MRTKVIVPAGAGWPAPEADANRTHRAGLKTTDHPM